MVEADDERGGGAAQVFGPHCTSSTPSWRTLIIQLVVMVGLVGNNAKYLNI